jgi:CheY-like chemotaxis protein
VTHAHALIIDDDSNNLAVLAEMLSLEDVTYTIVQNPTTVDNVVNQIPKVNVVFLDLEMPNVDGFTVFEKLKSHPRVQNVPIVAYTVHVSEINVARQLGFHSFLGKPLDADIFPDQLARILRGEKVWTIH